MKKSFTKHLPIVDIRQDILSNLIKMFTGNFHARYVNGNIISNPKGLKMCHINIRSLKNKIGEVKKLIADHKPHILGCSESELKISGQVEQLSSLKIPGYTLLLPQSWDLHGYARVVVYVKKSQHGCIRWALYSSFLTY